MRQFLFFLILSMTISSAGYSQGLRFYEINELEQYQQVLEKALEEDKMIFVAVYEEDGGFADMVRGNVFKDPSLARTYETVIAIATDVTSNMGVRMVESFGANNLPAFYYLSSEELLTATRTGSLTATELEEAMNEARQKARTYEELTQKYTSSNLSTAEWVELLDIYEMNFDFVETKELAHEFLAGLSNEQLLNPQVRPVLLSYGIDLETKYPEFIIENRNQISDTAYAAFYEGAYSYNFDRAVDNEDTVLLEKMVNRLIPASPEHDSLHPKLVFETKKVFAAETGLFDIWAQAAVDKSITEESDSLRAELIFAEAFEIADNFNSESAQKAALLLAGKANEIQSNFRYKMLQAYMLYLLKDYDKAQELVNEASAISGTKQNQKKAERLGEMIINEKQQQNEN